MEDLCLSGWLNAVAPICLFLEGTKTNAGVNGPVYSLLNQDKAVKDKRENPMGGKKRGVWFLRRRGSGRRRRRGGDVAALFNELVGDDVGLGARQIARVPPNLENEWDGRNKRDQGIAELGRRSQDGGGEINYEMDPVSVSASCGRTLWCGIGFVEKEYVCVGV